PDLEHPAPVVTLAFHPQSELLATACTDHSCRVFAVAAEQNTPLFTPVPHRALQYRNDGRTHLPPLFLDEGRGLLTVDQGEASWRDPRTGRVLRVLAAMPDYFTAIAFSADGKLVV